jgi:hypothetical protein
MNAALLAKLKAVPVPMTNPGQPAVVGVSLTMDGWQLYFLVGTHREHFGPVFASSREAIAASRALNSRNAL